MEIEYKNGKRRKIAENSIFATQKKKQQQQESHCF